MRRPNGLAEQIRYTGDVPPIVTFGPSEPVEPVMVVADPFANLRQNSADMDRQDEVMMRSINTMTMHPMPNVMQSGSGPMTIAAGPGVCTHSVQITNKGHAQPHVVSQTSGQRGTAPPQRRQPRCMCRPCSDLRTKADRSAEHDA